MATSKEERDEVAQEMFGKTFDECESMERIRVGAHIGGKRGGGRIHEMAEEKKQQAREGMGEEEGEGEEEEEEMGEEEGAEGEEQEGRATAKKQGEGKMRRKGRAK
ncbi:hypothetical protein VOLCADRAFT_95060 [Volvox carteri f. nagariensis]|uniref:Uncharacterized protein n=1 Tax=Volvox carteri f. nagariensis TaxID=3068 RepID=D8U6H4_VOLCA|nr:uncharacterized protein VOLCADRAFT_95060 [Volvox carteri f. nagariensis]EFJ44713.1 hypothetical protein VOLCADRAFT_95060 [Volvox carteri f. nagariensis]|eukprot:XP_002954289.1 hypothetical protein VOLCADRAFT_95060 [Volvox carteri f. nagariensis]